MREKKLKLKNVHHPAYNTQALVTKPTIYNAIMRMMLYGETWQRIPQQYPCNKSVNN